MFLRTLSGLLKFVLSQKDNLNEVLICIITFIIFLFLLGIIR